MAQIVVNGKVYTKKPGSCLGDVLSDCGVMAMPCGKHGKCGKCRVVAQGALSPLSATEENLLSEEDIAQGVRLACCTYVLGDCVITFEEKREEQICTQGVMPSFAVMPMFSKYGVAIDIGTTTLAARLYAADGNLLSEDSCVNPQSAFGADVISRVEAALSGKEKELSQAIVKALDGIFLSLAEKAGVKAFEIDGVVLTGNTAMLYLLTQTSVLPLSRAPFTMDYAFGETRTAESFGFCALTPKTRVYIPPCLAAFVGADTVTAILASELCTQNATRLIVDIGTNGEMALWHRDYLWVCSTAAGPAFEGVGISMGMAGTAGAVDQVKIVNGALCAHAIGEKAPVGICGSGIVDAVACLLDTEALDVSGYLEDETAIISSPVVLTQKDIRMVQLAKSAICAGLQTLLHEAGVSFDEVKDLLVAGGFGSYLHIKNACRIGLLPTELSEKVCVVGNAALMGASMLLLNQAFESDVKEMQNKTKVVELATNAFFMDAYIENMSFE